ncbi:MAG: hypothetical protein GXY76_02710 [Chloroflexi bacterium]|nr:hypothetical protein [Chloroflexota bacterium]
MVKVRVKMMVDDGEFAPLRTAEQTEGFEVTSEEFFLDGPVTKQVAVLDLDEKTGLLEPGVRYVPPPPGKTLGRYDIADPPDITSRAFNQVSVFATVLKTIQMFQKSDVLGREVSWAFEAPQLLVVPRAGQMENAYYECYSHSLQFFYFPSHVDKRKIVYTSLARDIVAHETGHAILDGIAPHLWSAIAPQSRALHEAIADLAALLVSIDSPTLREAVLAKTRGSIKQSTHFSALAEQFGMERGTGALRNLYDEDLVLGSHVRSEEHDLCRVLAAALFSVLVRMHEDRKRQLASGPDDYPVSGKALILAAEQFRRMVMRALDYLPPGEISFADYGRAIIAPDQAAYPRQKKERQWLCDEFVRRHMVDGPEALAVTPPPPDGLKGIDLQALVDSDWAAYDFANSERGRQLLAIPPGVQFHIEPRLQVDREYRHKKKDGKPNDQKVAECLFKAWWYHEEVNRLGPSFPGRRTIACGTTMAWDQETGELRVLLTSNPERHPGEHAVQQADRDAMLGRLVDEGVLRPGPPRLGPDGRPLRFEASVETTERTMRIASIARTFHLARGVLP